MTSDVAMEGPQSRIRLCNPLSEMSLKAQARLLLTMNMRIFVQPHGIPEAFTAGCTGYTNVIS